MPGRPRQIQQFPSTWQSRPQTRKARRDTFPGCNGNERVSQSRLNPLHTHSPALTFASAKNGKQLRSHVQQRYIKIEFRPRAPPNTNPEARSPARTCLSNQSRRLQAEGSASSDAGYVVTDFGPAAETHGGEARLCTQVSGKRSEVTPETNELKF